MGLLKTDSLEVHITKISARTPPLPIKKMGGYFKVPPRGSARMPHLRMRILGVPHIDLHIPGVNPFVLNMTDEMLLATGLIPMRRL